MTTPNLINIIQGRRSVRRFLPDPVPQAEILGLIAAAGWAPSPHGRQPWRFVILSAAATKQRLADAMAAEWRRQLTLDSQDAQEVDRRLAISRTRIMSAPTLILACLYMAEMDRYPDSERNTAEELMAIQSLGCAIQNMLLTAYDHGLACGWMCAPLFCPDVVRQALELDSALIPQALIPVGYAAAEPVRRPRKTVEELIVWR